MSTQKWLMAKLAGLALAGPSAPARAQNDPSTPGAPATPTPPTPAVQTAAQQARPDPMITGFNPADMKEVPYSPISGPGVTY
jgi:hypothetical protein